MVEPLTFSNLDPWELLSLEQLFKSAALNSQNPVSYVHTYACIVLYMYQYESVSLCDVIDDMILTNQSWANDGELLLLVTILEAFASSTLRARRRNRPSLIPCLFYWRGLNMTATA